jgi:hypothetical protein
MSRERARSYGATAVGLYALHDRAFFERLVKDPKKAVEEVGTRFKLTPDDKLQVVKLIEDRNKTHSLKEALAGWEKFKATGDWEASDWPRGWTPYDLSSR